MAEKKNSSYNYGNYVFLKEFLEYYSNEIDDNFFDDIKKNNNKLILHNDNASRVESAIMDEQTTKHFVEVVNKFKSKGIEIVFDEGFTVEQALNASRKVNDWIEEIKNARVNGKPLSVYEQYLYAFDIASQFEYNKENTGDDPSISRNIIKVLNGDKIVCVGYQSILKHILLGLNIPCAELSLWPNGNYTYGDETGHSACLVYLSDPIYGIEGACISDPTWGSPKYSKNIGQNAIYSLIPFEDANSFYETSNLKISKDNIEFSKIKCFENLYKNIDFKKIERYIKLNSEFETIKNKVEKELKDAELLIRLGWIEDINEGALNQEKMKENIESVAHKLISGDRFLTDEIAELLMGKIDQEEIINSIMSSYKLQLKQEILGNEINLLTDEDLKIIVYDYNNIMSNEIPSYKSQSLKETAQKMSCAYRNIGRSKGMNKEQASEFAQARIKGKVFKFELNSDSEIENI